MKIHFLRNAAIALGFCTAGLAHGQYDGYPAQNNGYGGDGFSAPPGALSAIPNRELASGSGLRPLPSIQAEPTSAESWVQYPSLPTFAPGSQPTMEGTPAPYQYQAVARRSQDLGGAVGSGHLPPPGQSVVAPGEGTLYPPATPDHSLSAPQPMVHGHHPSTGHQPSMGHHHEPHAHQYSQPSAPWVHASPEPCSTPAAIVNTEVPIRNWFGGSNILFFNFESECNRRLIFQDAMPSATMLQTDAVDPSTSVGFETFLGRYFACGRYAIEAGFFYFDPDEESSSITAPVAGDYRAAMPHWDRLIMDRNNDGTPDDLGAVGPGDDHLYGVYDAATAYRIRRDVDFRGLEFNFVAFAIGGAQRAGMLNCGTAACGPSFGDPCAVRGCGGLGGPMVPGCTNRVQLQFMHGLRWLSFDDDFEFGASVSDSAWGSGTDDFYYTVNAENDLIGYQLGSRINYALTCRVNLYAGAKFGLYANDVEYQARIGDYTTTALVGSYYSSFEDSQVHVSRSDTVLATLGELDLGMGVRLSNCWVLTGGYRLMGINGVATSVGSISNDPAHLTEGHLTCIDDSILLHGGYAGLQYNW